jgi:hypothetical protein
MKNSKDIMTEANQTSGNGFAMCKDSVCPEVGDTLTGGGQTLTVAELNISAESGISIKFENGQDVTWNQLADWLADGVVNFK